MMLGKVEGVQESELFVKVTGDYKEKIKTFLIIPTVKTYAEGGPAESNAEEFAYYLKNGKIPLPQNVDAYILAVTETDSSIAYGLKKFTTSKQQEIEISLHAATKEELMEAMREFDTERLHIKVADTKNASEIRKEDADQKKIDEQLKEAENLKPKRCDCDCGYLSPESAAAILKDTLIRTINYLTNSNKSTGSLSVKAYPNPSTNAFTIKINSNNQKDRISMRTIDIMGKLLELKDNLDPDQAITVGEKYKRGIHIVKIMQGQEQKTIRLIKQ